MKLANQIESILFYYAEPLSAVRLSKMLRSSVEEIRTAADELRSELSLRGIRLLIHADQYELVTSPESEAFLAELLKEELSKELSKSAVETLSIVLYKGPLTRSEIDYIRGVNSTFILRNLLIRGLIEKIDNPNDQRSYLYQATPDLLKQLGITSLTELPGYRDVQTQLETFSQQDTTTSDTSSSATNDTESIGSNTNVDDELTDAADRSELDEVAPKYHDTTLDSEIQRHE